MMPGCVRMGVVSLLWGLVLTACVGDDGAAGAVGPAGPSGASGPSGAAGTTSWLDGAGRVTTVADVGVGIADPTAPLHVGTVTDANPPPDGEGCARNFTTCMCNAGYSFEDTDQDGNIDAGECFRHAALFEHASVGLGTSQPMNRLHLHSTSSDYVSVQFTNASTAFDSPIGGLRVGLTGNEDGVVFMGESHHLLMGTSNTERVRIGSDGNVGVGTTAPTARLDVNSDTWRLRMPKTPATSNEACNQGDMAWDASYLYVCVITNTWKRSVLTTF